MGRRAEYVVVLLLLEVAAGGGASLDSCTSSRPGGGATYDHRTLQYPASLAGAVTTPQEQAAADQLCCVYTRVALVSGGRAVLLTYDGGSNDFGTGSFMVVAQQVLDSACGMSMGSADCANRKGCIDAAAKSANFSAVLKTSAAASTSKLLPAQALLLLLPSLLLVLGGRQQ
jgi:hypothetical protein